MRNGVEANRFRFVQWDITARCNLACIHCRSESFYGEGDLEKDMPLDAIKRQLDGLYDKGIRRIHFLGGEPFSRLDLPEIVRHGTDLGILCSVNTNGTMINDERAEAILQAGTYLLTFSIDGCDAATNDYIRGKGTFDKILRGIRYVQEAKRRLHAGTRLICSHVVMRPNSKMIDRMVDLCTDLGLQNIIATNLRYMGGARRIFRQLALSPGERMEAAECLAARMARPGRRCHVQIEIVGLLGKIFLNAKYGLGLEVGRGGCNAIATKAYMQPDGALFPCQDVASEVGKLEERDRIRGEGVQSWESQRFAAIARSITSFDVYRDYVPCGSCPALGTLCTPCPLPGLRGVKTKQDGCLRIMRRAKQEGVDLRAGLAEATRSSALDRILQDPAERRRFFSADDPDALLRDTLGRARERERLIQFRDATLAELQPVLEAGAASLGWRRTESCDDSMES